VRLPGVRHPARPVARRPDARPVAALADRRTGWPSRAAVPVAAAVAGPRDRGVGPRRRDGGGDRRATRRAGRPRTGATPAPPRPRTTCTGRSTATSARDRRRACSPPTPRGSRAGPQLDPPRGGGGARGRSAVSCSTTTRRCCCSTRPGSSSTRCGRSPTRSAPSGRRRRHLRGQPQPQLHQHLLHRLPVLRVRAAPRRPGRLQPVARRDRRPGRGGLGRRRDRGVHAGRHPPGPAGRLLLRRPRRREGAGPRHPRARLLSRWRSSTARPGWGSRSASG
jgi:hypothetical protein